MATNCVATHMDLVTIPELVEQTYYIQHRNNAGIRPRSIRYVYSILRMRNKIKRNFFCGRRSFHSATVHVLSPLFYMVVCKYNSMSSEKAELRGRGEYCSMGLMRVLHGEAKKRCHTKVW